MNATYIYQNRDGTNTIRGIPAQVVGEALEQIRLANGGKLTPAAVVRAARDVDHPLHRAFTWDDGKAANAYRIWQARQLIRSVVMVVVKDEKRTIVPRYLHIPASKRADQHYQATEVVVTRENEFSAALNQLRAKAESILETIRRVRSLAQLMEHEAELIETAALHFESGLSALSELSMQVQGG